MTKNSSYLIGMPVLLQREKALVGAVQSLVIHPDTGEFIGILVREGFGKQRIRSLAIKDVVTITSKFFMIDSYESLGDIDEIVRIKEVLSRGVEIRKCRVNTVSGLFLGKVKEYSVNLKSMRLDKITVDSLWTLATQKHYLISFNQIVSIEPGKITVEDSLVKNKANAKAEVAEAL